jgi:SAM-dependent methyltransferase
MVEDHFGESVAERYDADVAGEFAPDVVEPIVNFLYEQAPQGTALEFGIGTGRIAIPLSQRGVHVQGIDLSTAMVERMREKPGGRAIEVSLGDFAATTIDRTFDLVYLLFNTIMNLTTQEEQVACFINAAAHLKPRGRFLVEVLIPDLRRLPPGDKVRTYLIEPEALSFDVYDVARQGLVSHHYRAEGGQLDLLSIPFRYAWPSEFDLMARIAGMRLRERWSDWARAPFTSESTKHVSVWEKRE